MTTELATVSGGIVDAPTTVGLDTIPGFELAQRIGIMLSKSSMVPKDYQGAAGVSNCIIALNMSHRTGADVLQIMQNLYMVHGRPGWSSQFLIATFNTCERYTSIRYRFTGDKGTDSWGCVAYAREKIDGVIGDLIEGTEVTIKMAKDEGWHGKSGSKWKTMPEQMLSYRAAAFLARIYAPELSMGLHAADELHDAHAAPEATVHTVTVQETTPHRDVQRMRAVLVDPLEDEEISDPKFAEMDPLSMIEQFQQAAAKQTTREGLRDLCRQYEEDFPEAATALGEVYADLDGRFRAEAESE